MGAVDFEPGGLQRLIGDAAPRVDAVYPARVPDTQLVHLASALVSDDGDVSMRAICPGGQSITAVLEPVEADAVFVWCPACRSWADAAGVKLPRSR